MNNKELKMKFIHSLRDKTARILTELNQEFSQVPDFDTKWLDISVDKYNQNYHIIKNMILYFPQFK